MAFKAYINTNEANKTMFKNNFENIANAILNYTKPKNSSNSDYSESETQLKNGYATVLTDYIVANPDMIKVYSTYLLKNNLNILGTDKDTRTTNYNKLITVWKTNREKFSIEEKNQIIEMGKTIDTTVKLTQKEMIEKGIDSLMDKF
jgi:hypothetical protein